jgi:hypothetical protein
MGFVVFMVIGVYLLISFGVVAGAVRYATKHGKSPIRWGLSAALVMFLIPCWDWIPTVVAHKYYCEKEAGFWVYKTLDQWKAENPGVLLNLEGRSTNTHNEEHEYTETHQLNQRINWVIKLRGLSSILQISKREESLVDGKNNEVLARLVDFSRGDQRSTGEIKFWLVSSDCNGGETFRVRMGQLIDNIYADVNGDKK